MSFLKKSKTNTAKDCKNIQDLLVFDMQCQNISLAQYFTRKAFILQLVGSKLWEVSDGRVRLYYLTFVCQMVSLIGENKSFYFCMRLVITERLCITDKELEMMLGKKITF